MNVLFCARTGLRSARIVASRAPRVPRVPSFKFAQRTYAAEEPVKKKVAQTLPVVAESEKMNSTVTVLKTFVQYLWPSETKLKIRVVTALTLLVTGKLLNVQVPYIFKEIVDALNFQGAEAVVAVPLALLISYGAARVGATLFQELRNGMFARLTQNAICTISDQTYFHLLNLDLKYHMSRETGGLSRAIDRGTRGISFIMHALLFNIVPIALEIALVSGIMAFSFGTAYTIITCITIGLYTAFTVSLTEYRTKLRRQLNSLENQAASVSVDALLNFETVKYFNNELHERERYAKILRESAIAGEKVQWSLAALNFGQNFIFTVAIAAVMVMISHDIIQGTYTIGDLVMVNTLLFQLSMPLNFLGTVYRETRQAIVDLDTLFSLNKVKALVKDSPDLPELQITNGDVEFKDISFAYENGKQILNKLSMKIPGKAKVAIVGSSGGGKTTLFRMLFRFYDPDSGEIYIDGQRINDVTLNSLRQHIAVVPQDLVLFNHTLRYNIAYGNINATDEEIVACAKLAHIHDQIMKMPNGYDTMVGERGLKLSGGEKQRVCLARALMKNPKILLMDEATSGLDAESESSIHEALDEITQGRTVIMISHRLQTVQTADLIYVFDSGKIVEEGDHAQLMEKNGAYRQLVRLASLKQD